TSFGCSGGRPASLSAPATPSRRKISIERADTWLHFTLGGSPRLRVSATSTSTPRRARSMASVRPTGPAPTMSTWAESVLLIGVVGGVGGIRTLDTGLSPYNALAGRPLRPLGHHSWWIRKHETRRCGAKGSILPCYI